MRLARYTALSQAHWPAACSRSHFLALVRTHATNATTTLTMPPAAGPGQGGTYGVDWGDGSAPDSCAHANGAVCTHTYASAGDYWLRLSVRVDGLWYVEGAWVVDVVAWGDVQLYHPVGSTTPLFTRAPYPSSANEFLLRYLAPTAGSRALRDVAPEYLLSYMSDFVGDARDWDWSWLTPATHPNGFASLFQYCAKFNQDLDGWNTSGVASLAATFWRAKAFNGSIGGWNTSQVTSLDATFMEAYAFNRPIGGWNTSRVTSLSETFNGAYAFNQPIGGWNTSRVTSLYGTFANTYVFNQPIGDWDTSRVTSLARTFGSTYAFNQPIGGWNISSVSNLTSAFKCDPADRCVFNQPLGNWDVSAAMAASRFVGMFGGNCVFDQDLTAWNVASTTGAYVCTQIFQSRGIYLSNMGIQPSNLPARCREVYVRGCGNPSW